MKSFIEFSRQIDEKQIQYGGNANYGQVVFFAGGAGSGKGFAISNFIDKNKFKIYDVDDLKLKITRLPKMIQKYPDIQNLKLSNPEDVRRLHAIASAEKIPEKELDAWINNFHYPETLPNLLFDMTFKTLENATWVIPSLLRAGYKSRNIHITWVLTNYNVAVVNNKGRERIVPDDIMLLTHTGAALTMGNLLSGNLPKDFDGSFTIILNNPEETKYYPKLVPVYKKGDKFSPSHSGELEIDKHGKPIYIKIVKDFTYIKIKNPGQPLPAFQEMDAQLRQTICKWVLENAPKIKEIEDVYGDR
jgi:hypothetical protein